MAEDGSDDTSEAAPRSDRGVLWWRVLRAFALGPVIVVGWVALLLWVLAIALEQTGVLNSLVTSEAARRLGPVANDFRIARTEIDWLRRSVRLAGISSGRGGKDVYIEELELLFGWDAERGPRLERADVRGGNLRISRALMNGIQGLVQARDPHDEALLLPTIVVNRLLVEVETPTWGDIQTGQVDACLRPAPGGLRHLTGRLLPPGSSPDRSGGAVYLNGELDREGVLFVRAAARSLPLSTDYVPRGTPLDGLRAWNATATLDLEATGRFDAGRSLFPTFETKLTLSDGRLALPHVEDEELSRVEGLRLELRSDFRPAPAQALWDPEAWHGTARLEATWRGEPAEAWLLMGEDTTPGELAEGWVHLPRVAAGPELAQLSSARIWSEILAQFEPEGTAAVSFGMRLPERWTVDDGVARGAERCLAVRGSGDISVAYHGRANRRDGARDAGFPMRVGAIDGRFLYAFNPEITLPEQMGFVELAGTSAGGDVRVEGFVHSRPRWFLATGAPRWMSEWEFFLGAQGTGLAVGPELEAGLVGLRGVIAPEDVWDRYAPRGGQVDFDLGLWHNTTVPGLATQLSMVLDGVETRWSEFPIELTDTRGRIDVWYDGTPAVSGSAGWAVDVDARAESAVSRFPVEVRSRTRGEAAGSDGALRRQVSHTAVRARGVNLKARELRTVLTEKRDTAVAILDSVGAQGFVDLSLVYSLPIEDARPRLVCEIQPGADGVEILPAAFPMPTRNLEGRTILITELEPETDSRLDVLVSPLIGTWSGEQGPTPIAIRAHFPSERPAQLELLGSGLDTTNRSLLGSIRQALSGSSPDTGVDLSSVGFEGQLDVSAILDLEDSASAIRQLNGHLRSGVFGPPDRPILRELRGALRWEDETLRSDRLQAVIGSTPIELTDFELTSRDGETRVGAYLSAPDLPLDYEHLESFLDPETLAILLDDLHWGGRVDIEHGRLDVRRAPDSDPVVRFRGELGVSSMDIDLGVPISVQSARVTDLDLTLEAGRVRALARVGDVYGQIAGHQVERAQMMATFVQPHLSIQNLEGQFEGGSLRSRGDVAGTSIGASLLSIDLVPPFPFRLSFEVDRVDVGQLLAGIFNSDFANEGRVQGALNLHGNIERLTDIRGSGYSTLSDSALWAIPVFQNLFSQLGFESSATFNEMGSHFRIEDGTVYMTDMRVKSDLLTLVGEGSFDLEGHLDYDLEVHYALVDRLGPLTRLLYIIQNSLLRISIRGDMSRPKVILKGIISQFLPNVGEGPPELPLPGYSELPHRF